MLPNRMMTKKIYQCNKKCESCTYENKNPNGYDTLSECITDKCPNGQYELGYIDVVGGKHTEDGNWNPKGEFCAKCSCESCEECEAWKNKQQEHKPVIQKQTTKQKISWDDIFDDEPQEKQEIVAVKEDEHKPDKIDAQEEIAPLQSIVEAEVIEETPVEEVIVFTEGNDEKPVNNTEVDEIVSATNKNKINEEAEENIPPVVMNIIEDITAEEAVEPVALKKASILDDDIDDFDLLKKHNDKKVIHENQTELPTAIVGEKVNETETFKDIVAEKEPTSPIPSGIEIDIEETENKGKSTFEYINELIKKILSARWLKRNKGKKIEDVPNFDLPEKPDEEIVTNKTNNDEKEEKPTTETIDKQTIESVQSDHVALIDETELETVVTKTEETNSNKLDIDNAMVENVNTDEVEKKSNIVIEQVKVETEPVNSPDDIKQMEEKDEDVSDAILVVDNNTKHIETHNLDNPYIKAHWLDDEEEEDIDENGNIVQGIYRIDASGSKTIVTAFDDDKNVRFTRYSKPIRRIEETPKPTIAIEESSVEVEENDTTTVNETDIEPAERYPDGVNIKTNMKPQVTTIEIEQPTVSTEIPEDDINEEYSESDADVDIDFGDDLEMTDDGIGYDDGYNDSMFEEDDEIPEPEEYKTERQEYEDAGIETEEAEEVDEDYEDADFDMTDSAKFKASLLSPIGEEIARLQIKNAGVYLTVLGSCKITIKGRNDSDGFSYKDAKRFPKYIIDKVLNKSIYRDPNMEVIDETYFNITYFEIRNEEIMPIEDVRLDITFDDPTPDKVKQVLYNEYKKFKNN